MMLGPWARNRGNGRKFLKYIEECARQKKGEKNFLAVLGINPRARDFWEREGF
jgi:GNAT superfamily N-acetyltransferase